MRTTNLKTMVVILLFLLGMVSTATGEIIYVDASAAGNNDGSSWGDAYNYLQDALADAGLSGNDIWVAEGTYTPDSNSANPGGTGDRTATFQLINGVGLYGGFPSGGGNWEDRDPNTHETILSGDLNGDDGPDWANNGENTYHVVTGSGTDTTAVLAGFTITGGNGSGVGAYLHGGGMFNQAGSPSVVSCTFRGNFANPRSAGGAGMYNVGSSPTLTNCTFSGNSARFGGGMRNRSNSSPTVVNCTFSGNGALAGGGMYNGQSNPIVTNCVFSGNQAGSLGGGMANGLSSPTLTNCTFSGNSAGELGGGIGNANYSSPTLTNCILWGDSAPSGPEIINYTSSTPTVTYSDVAGGYTGTGNIDADPCFADADSSDFHLLPGSPCIDAGTNDAPELPETDFEGEPRIIDGDHDGEAVVDMGADEHFPPLYVDCDAPVGGNGQSWGTAYKYLQDALYKPSTSGDQIWVAAGIYKPDQDEAGNVTPGERSATFQLKNGVAMCGGFAGNEDPATFNLDDRDFETNETILSGDLDGDDEVFTNNGENSFHVVTGSGTDTTAVIDGFTITAGNANGGSYPYREGGGMFNYAGSPTLTNCTFSGNWTRWVGGGMCNWGGSSPTLTNCTFGGNIAGGYAGGGGMFTGEGGSPMLTNCTFSGNSAGLGGGMYNAHSNATLTNCSFTGNSAGIRGGGMYNAHSNATLTNCTFSRNNTGGTEHYGGGGMHNQTSSATLTNCTFSGNSAGAYGGGGMCNFSGSTPTLANCTFSGNSARGYDGAGMSNFFGSSPTLANCVLWGNTGQIYNDGTSLVTVSYSDVQGGWLGTGNIDADPCFADAASNDYHLLPDSPCIDAGDNTAVPPDSADLDEDGDTTERIPFDLDGNPRFVDFPPTGGSGVPDPPDYNDIVDMGAYEAALPSIIEVAMKFTPQALNPGSQGNWVKAHFVLPAEFGIEDVDTDAGATIEPLGIESDYMNVFINEDELVEIEAAFSRSDFCGSATSDDDTEVIVIGQLTSGQNFYGTDTIRIITHNLKYVAVFASHWLEANCGKPDWCGGLDLDQDSVVNFIDFALFDGCCIEITK